MSTPQQPELHRSRETPEMDLDNIAGDLEGRDRPGSRGGGLAPVPEANQPGHHPAQEQDKPDMAAFIARASGEEDEGAATDDSEVAPPRGRAADAPATGPSLVGRLTSVAGQTTAAALTALAAGARFTAAVLETVGDRVAPDRG